jgi:hypothetical protein
MVYRPPLEPGQALGLGAEGPILPVVGEQTAVDRGLAVEVMERMSSKETNPEKRRCFTMCSAPAKAFGELGGGDAAHAPRTLDDDVAGCSVTPDAR